MFCFICALQLRAAHMRGFVPLRFIHTHISPIAHLPNCTGVVCNNKDPGSCVKDRKLPRPVFFKHCSQVGYSRWIKIEGVIVYFLDSSCSSFFSMEDRFSLLSAIPGTTGAIKIHVLIPAAVNWARACSRLSGEGRRAQGVLPHVGP